MENKKIIIYVGKGNPIPKSTEEELEGTEQDRISLMQETPFSEDMPTSEYLALRGASSTQKYEERFGSEKNKSKFIR